MTPRGPQSEAGQGRSQGLSVVLLLALAILGALPGAPAVAQIAPQLVPTLGHPNKIASVAYSADGRFLISGGDDGVAILWDIATGAEIKRFAVDTPLRQVEFIDGDRRFFAGYEDGKARLWDTMSGRVLQTFDGYVSLLAHDYLYGNPFAISPDGGLVATADKEGDIQLWDTATGTSAGRFAAELGKIGHIQFATTGSQMLVSGMQGSALFDRVRGKALWTSRDDTGAVLFAGGDRVLTSSVDGVRVRSRVDGTIIRTIAMESADALSLSPDGKILLGAAFTHGAALFEVNSGGKLWDLPDVFGGGEIISASGVAIAPDGRSFAVAPVDRRMGSWDSDIRIFSTEGYAPIRTLDGQTARLVAIGFNGHHPYIVGADESGGAHFWRGEGRVIPLRGHIAPVIAGAFSNDGGYLALGSLDNSGSLWRTSGDQRFKFVSHSQYVGSVAFSHDATQAFSTGGPGFAWSIDTGGKIARYGSREYGGAVLKIAPSGNDAYVITEAFGQLRLFTRSGEEQPLPKALEKPAGSRSSLPTISADGRIVTVECTGRSPQPVPAELGFITRCADAVHGVVHGVSKDGTWILSSHGSLAYLQNGETTLSFDQHRGVDFMALSEDTQLLLTGSLQDNIVHLWDVRLQKELCRVIITTSGHWVVLDPEGRFDTDDIEGLRGLSWLLPEDPLRPLPLEIFMKDFFTPNLLSRTFLGDVQSVGAIRVPTIMTPKVVFEKIETNAATGRVLLRLNIAGVDDRDAFDLHVFRDGQLVARLPDDGASVARYVKGGAITLTDIQVPRGPAARKVRFSAYAFNREHIKGETAETTVTLESAVTPPHPTAYVLTFGVNIFEDPVWNLGFAANDARAMSRDVTTALRETKQFEKVVPIPLVSDTHSRSRERPATRENLRKALEALSGYGAAAKPSGGALNIGLQRSRPQDLVIIHIATHGYADKDGIFYILPHDIGADVGKTLSAKLKAASISSNDLNAWLAGIDAREIVVILDTCQSAAVTGPAFKPAPIGNRSFGQLVFNKKMRLLVSTQADAAALEIGDLRHGLMTYALVQNGLKSKRADFAPYDHSTTFAEWLRYGLEDVIRFQGAAGQARAPAKPGPDTIRGTVSSTVALDDVERAAQVPVLFDFGYSDSLVLSGVPIFDSASVPSDDPWVELKAAMDVQDPTAAAAALRRFISKQRPGAFTAVAWTAIVANLLESDAPLNDLISAARVSLEHLALMNDKRTAYNVLTQVSAKLEERKAYPDVESEFRTLAERL